MNLFRKKPLSLILCTTLGGFSLFAFSSEAVVTVSAVVALALLLLFICIGKFRRLLYILTVAAFFLSLIASYIYFNLWFPAARRFDGKTVRVDAVVTDVGESVYGKTVFDIKTQSVNGEPLTAGYGLSLELSEEYGAVLRRGSLISLDCELRAFEGTESFDAERFYAAQGLSAEAIAVDAPEIIGSSSIPDLGYLAELITRRSIMLSNEEAGGLFTALFTGDRSHLTPGLTLAFTRIGINHILALSGAHFAMISMLMHVLLSVLGIGKRARWAIIIPTAFFYMWLTGFSPSVTRAGVMLAVTGLSHASARSHDSITSLSVAMLLICLAEPYSVLDLGLWLSALATLGIIEASELNRRGGSRWVYYKKRRKRSRPRELLTGLLLTFFAVGGTLAISVFSFSGISPLSVITTPIFSLITEVYIYVGLAALILGDVLPIGRLLCPMYDITYALATGISDNELVYFSTGFTAVKVAAIVFTVCFAVFLVIKLPPVRRAVCAALVAVMILSIFATSAVMTVSSRADDSLVYLQGARAECFIVKSEGYAAAIDLSSGNAVSTYDVRDALDGEATVSLDRLVFCYYSANLPEKALGIASATLVRELTLPRPENSAERKIALSVEAAVAELGIKVSYHGGAFRIGEVTVTEKYRTPYGEGAAVSVISLSHGGEEIAYLSSGVLEDKLGKQFAADALSCAECAVLGSGGRKYKERAVISERYPDLREVVVSGENLVFTQDARVYYGERGAEFRLRPKRVELLDKED